MSLPAPLYPSNTTRSIALHSKSHAHYDATTNDTEYLCQICYQPQDMSRQPQYARATFASNEKSTQPMSKFQTSRDRRTSKKVQSTLQKVPAAAALPFKASLMTIPPELRLKIYGLLLPRSHIFRSPDYSAFRSIDQDAIFGTCKTIREEILGLELSSVPLRVDDAYINPLLFFPSPGRFEIARLQLLKITLRGTVFDDVGNDVLALIRRARALRKVVVDCPDLRLRHDVFSAKTNHLARRSFPARKAEFGRLMNNNQGISALASALFPLYFDEDERKPGFKISILFEISSFSGDHLLATYKGRFAPLEFRTEVNIDGQWLYAPQESYPSIEDAN